MREHQKKIRWGLITAIVPLALVLVSGNVYASDGSGGWRPIYDTVMMIFNFALLVFLFLRYAKTPLKNFLDDRKFEIARELQRIEDEKQDWMKKIESAKKDLDESEERFANIKQRMIQEGENKKQELIDGARRQGEAMIDKARRKIDNDILLAKKTLRSELVDAAIDLALKKLPAKMTQQDKDKFINMYLNTISAE